METEDMTGKAKPTAPDQDMTANASNAPPSSSPRTSSIPTSTPQQQQPPAVRLQLHDAIALGELESGIWLHDGPSVQELERLPHLMRLLESSRPLATGVTKMELSRLQQQQQEEEDTHHGDDDDDNDDEDESTDTVIQKIVHRLEERAALYPEADGLEMTTCQWAPLCCHKRTKISKFKRFEQLKDVADYKSLEQSKSRQKKKRGTAGEAKKTTAKSNSDNHGNDINQDDDDDDDDLSDIVMEDVAQPNATTTSDNMLKEDDDSVRPFQLHKEDTMDVTVTKTVCALAQLLVEASSPANTESLSTESSSLSESMPRLQQVLSDSILAQSKSKDMMGNDLGSTVVAILHHAPVIQYKELATALCRAAFPQSSLLIGRMGANCPTAVPCLLRGCIDAYQISAIHPSTARTARNGVEALAKLSDRESSRVRNVLRKHGCMLDLQLELALRQAPMEAACMIIEHLSRDDNTMENGISISESQSVASNDQRQGFTSSSPLRQWLCEKPSRFTEAVRILTAFLTKRRLGFAMIFHGDVVLTLRAMGLLFYRVGLRCQDLSDNSELEETLESCVYELKEWAGSLRGLLLSRESPATEVCHLDLPFRLIAITALLHLGMLMQVVGNDSVKLHQSLSLVQNLFIGGVSHTSDALLARLAFAIRKRSLVLVDEILLDDTFLSKKVLMAIIEHERLHDACYLLSSTCASELEVMIKRSTSIDCFCADPRVCLGLIENSTYCKEISAAVADEVLCLLKLVVNDSKCAMLLLRSRHVHDVIDKATDMLVDTGHCLPLVAPYQIETMGNHLQFCCDDKLSDVHGLFLLRLMYCFSFIKAVGSLNAPFVFEPRNLPLKQIRLLCLSMSDDGLISSHFLEALLRQVDLFCPEVADQQAYLVVTSDSRLSLTEDADSHVISCKKDLLATLRKSLDVPESDFSGRLAEQAFLSAMPLLSEGDLCTSVVSAILAQPKLPPRYYSYSACCRDPLVLLRSPISAWQREGLRRLAVWTLESLLEANNNIVRDLAPTEDSRIELISARDALLVRALVIATSTTIGFCAMTLQLIRKMVAKGRGLLATLLKQGFQERAVDWLIEWVPEVMDDADSLLMLLTDRCLLTTSERLSVADAVLRIAIAHGHRRPQQAKSLAYTALAQLIGSFFLVLGPVGVPVNTVIGDGVGPDATHQSRRAAFRMLEAMHKLSSYRSSIKGECVLALQKLGGLVKGESMVGGLPVSVANRQKSVLKRLMDEINKASVALGDEPIQ